MTRYVAVDGIERKKVNALVLSVREEICDHKHAAYIGRIPCTGRFACSMCGATVRTEASK